MNQVWITDNLSLTEPYVFDDQTKNVVVTGKITSTSDITFKVNNLIVFGGIETTEKLTLVAKENIYNTGLIKGKSANFQSDTIFNGLSDQAIETINALGVYLVKNSDGMLRVRLSQS